MLENAQNVQNVAQKPPGTKLAKIDFSRFLPPILAIFSISTGLMMP